MPSFSVLVEWSGVVAGILGAVLLYRQRPGSKAWLAWVGIAVLCLLGIIFKL
jgi:arginine exporter protein ArgO